MAKKKKPVQKKTAKKPPVLNEADLAYMDSTLVMVGVGEVQSTKYLDNKKEVKAFFDNGGNLLLIEFTGTHTIRSYHLGVLH